MNILAFADVRTTLKLPDVDPDVVLLLGDIPSKMVSKINRRYSCKKLGVLGNHCHHENFNDTQVINMHNKILTIDGVTFAGFQGSPVYKSYRFGQHTETEAEMFVQKIGDRKIDILLAHSNPAFGDMDLDEAHRGFQAFNNLILGQNLKHFFHGHLHDPFTRIVNDCTVHSVYPYLWIQNMKI